MVLINVLEHVENDEELLSTIHQVLKPGGTLLLFVPALPGLYGALVENFFIGDIGKASWVHC